MNKIKIMCIDAYILGKITFFSYPKKNKGTSNVYVLGKIIFLRIIYIHKSISISYLKVFNA